VPNSAVSLPAGAELRFRLAARLSIAFLLLLPPSTAASDFTILPGSRFGPVTETTSRRDLPRLFHGAVIEDTRV
jgi:hypothetical protein